VIVGMIDSEWGVRTFLCYVVRKSHRLRSANHSVRPSARAHPEAMIVFYMERDVPS